MNPLSSTTAAPLDNAQLGSVQGSAGLSVMKKAMSMQSSAVSELLQALPQPALATSGSLGTQVNTYA